MAGKLVGIASDHAGFELKKILLQELESLGYEVIDFGTDSQDSVDYPDFGGRLGLAVNNNEVENGVLICSSGIGMSIAANRYKGVRAALVRDDEDVVLCRQHNDANVIVFGAHKTSAEDALHMLRIFFTTPFLEGRHTIRVKKLGQLPK